MITLRPYDPDDAPALLALFRDTIRRVNSRDYSPAQVAAWASDDIDRVRWFGRFSGRFVPVAEVDGRPVGFAELESDGHIDRVYVSADHQRRGIGRQMLTALVVEAQRLRLARLFTEASITARPFFESQGFTTLAPQVVNCRGADFINYRMERVLAEPATPDGVVRPGIESATVPVKYLFTHEDKTERERLAAIEAGLDPFTIECLEKLGVGEGWRCLEVGAGGGSISAWLCRRVGTNGKVVATDLQTKFLEAVDAPNLKVRQHDITKEELEPAAFDLVSARKVLEHLPDPSAALRRMAAALRPGGWLLVEDTDLASFMRVSFPHRERFERAYGKFIEALSSAGYQPKLGLRLGDELRAAGLRDVALKGFVVEASGDSGHPGIKVFRMTIQRMRERIVKAGLLSDTEIDQFVADFQSPEFHAMTSVHCAAWGRKPAAQAVEPDTGKGGDSSLV